MMREGYDLLRSGRVAEARDCWLQRWESIKRLANPMLRTTTEFDWMKA